MRYRKMLLGLVLIGLTTVASAAGGGKLYGGLPPPGWVYSYIDEDGAIVGRAVHNQCTGEISITGTVTDQAYGSQTVSC